MDKSSKATVRFHQPKIYDQFTAWLVSHLRAFIFSLGKLYRSPAATVMTLSVIGIALALPTTLYLILFNIQSVSGGWDQASQVSLFLYQDSSDEALKTTAQTVLARPEVSQVQTLTADQALEEFKTYSGFSEALNDLDENPLPPVVLVFPAVDQSSPEALETLVETLRNLSTVESAQLDITWVQRLYALIHMVERAVWIIGIMLNVAILLIVGNTIRLDILNRREEIEVAKLIGATDAFIRRPFLYGGLWYGLIGGFLSIVIVSGALLLISEPAGELLHSYSSDFQLIGLSLDNAFTLLLLSSMLGLGGSWIAVGRHLKQIEPS